MPLRLSIPIDIDDLKKPLGIRWIYVNRLEELLPRALGTWWWTRPPASSMIESWFLMKTSKGWYGLRLPPLSSTCQPLGKHRLPGYTAGVDVWSKISSGLMKPDPSMSISLKSRRACHGRGAQEKKHSWEIWLSSRVAALGMRSLWQISPANAWSLPSLPGRYDSSAAAPWPAGS